MSVTLYDDKDKAIAGNGILDAGMIKMADAVEGRYILDDQTGDQVYPVTEVDDGGE